MTIPTEATNPLFDQNFNDCLFKIIDSFTESLRLNFKISAPMQLKAISNIIKSIPEKDYSIEGLLSEI
jgi:hypothetical protein